MSSSLPLILFLAGVLTILLPCVLPLLPIVLGVSIAGRSPLRPIFTVVGMAVSFIASTFILLTALRQFPETADTVRTATFALLFLFGVGFSVSSAWVMRIAGVLTSLFFLEKGLVPMFTAGTVGLFAAEYGPLIASRIQNLGATLQSSARKDFGSDSPLTALIVGLSLGLVWVPCAGPALGFVLTLVREEPGLRSLFLLSCYALGASLPLLIVGYGGQYAVSTVKTLSRYTGIVKKIAGFLLIMTAVTLHLGLFERAQVFLLEHTSFGSLATRLEERLFQKKANSSFDSLVPTSPAAPTKPFMSTLPKLIRAPEFSGLAPWHNTEPFTLQSLRGKVVLVDFWTYSCINCIRTLPFIQGYWEKYKDTGKFVLLGVHSPEFAFEHVSANVKTAIQKHHLTYPIAQDNDFATWSAFANRYWPAKYLIDADGVIRYTHFGEGGYDETDAAIQSLLAEIGVKSPTLSQGQISAEQQNQGGGAVSPETYLSSRSWPAFGNSKGEPTADTVTYKAPDVMTLNTYYLVGDWQLVNDEYQVLHSETGEIRMRFFGGEINMVLGVFAKEGFVGSEVEKFAPRATVFIDGREVKNFRVTQHDLYSLWKGEYGEHTLTLSFSKRGVEAYAFTFGR